MYFAYNVVKWRGSCHGGEMPTSIAHTVTRSYSSVHLARDWFPD